MPSVQKHYLYERQEVFNILIQSWLSSGECWVEFSSNGNSFAPLFLQPLILHGNVEEIYARWRIPYIWSSFFVM